MGWEVRALKRWNKFKKEIFGDKTGGSKYEIAFSDFEGAIPEFTWGEDTVEETKESATKILSYFKRGVVEISVSETGVFVDFIKWKDKEERK